MQLSVIIPTYNRADTFKQCLEYLQKQTVRDFEVIVIDDGSTDNTRQIVENFPPMQGFNLKYLYQENKKQGAARNLGIQNATGEIILFLGDDIFALPNLLEEHLTVHKHFPEKNIAVLGYTTWYPLLKINAYMRFLEWSGWQFNYPQIENFEPFTKFNEYKEFNHSGKFLPPQKQFWFFYTSNLSLKKSLLLQESFDENFRAYGWEDIELGQRLTLKKQLHLFYNPDAYAYHHHFQEESELGNKMQTLASSLQFAPQLAPPRWKIYCFSVILNSLSLKLLQWLSPEKWYLWAKAKKMFYQAL